MTCVAILTGSRKEEEEAGQKCVKINETSWEMVNKSSIEGNKHMFHPGNRKVWEVTSC